MIFQISLNPDMSMVDVIIQMEVLAAQNGSLTPIDFHQFIKKVEHNSQKSLLSKRRRRILRKKIKDNWLIKSKIIPPSFQKIQKENAPEFRSMHGVLHFASFYDKATTNEANDSFEQAKPLRKTQCAKNEKSPRKQCKTSHAVLRSSGSCEKLRSNWKLQFRRDELNVLKYRRQEENLPQIDLNNAEKTYRLRKMPRKFQQVKPQIYQLYKTNLEILKETASPNSSPFSVASPKITQIRYRSRQ